ncbi:MAG TPA: FG-GAP repeat protein [Burkholderiales bacterium]|nr:FG-GAP repeat protein [Burkholderiales bacterium]
MRTYSQEFRGASGIAVAALALLLASCAKPTSYNYTVGGTVSGLSGAGLVLRNNGSDNLAVSTSGAFTFSKTVKKDAGYSVTVSAQPTGQTCTVTNGSGTVQSNVTNVAVGCVSDGFTVGGAVSGLAGTGLVLQNNGGNSLPVSASGAFTFSAPVAAGGAFSVTVLTQPSGQMCTVSNGAGTATANVTNVAVACASNVFTVGGMASGLTGTGLVLRNNGGNDLTVQNDGAFTFTTALADAATYSVSVLTPPAGEGCSVANGSGTIAGANVINVLVTCAAPPAAPSVGLAFGVKELQFTWPAASGATFYRLLENPDGVSGYAQVATNITALGYSHTIPVHRRLNASYKIEACNAGGCTASATVNLGIDLTQAIGYMKASNTGAGDQFGMSVALSGDGNTLAVSAHREDGSGTGVNSASNESARDAGAVYVFAKIAGTWLQEAYVKASNTAANDTFGYSIALSSDGNTLAVGARGKAGGAGAAYVFTRAGGVWSQQASLTASNADANGLFGNVVSLSGDGNTLAVGAPFESGDLIGVTAGSPTGADTGNANFFSGAAYVYVRSGAVWSQQAYVKASNPEMFDLFGSAVALSGDGNTLAVGATLEDGGLTGVTPNAVDEAASGNASSNSGAVYVYTRAAGAWSQQAYVKASNTGDNDQFGTAVALSSDGSVLAVGAPFEASSSNGVNGASDELASGAGAVYVYARSGTAWSQQAFVKASNTGPGDSFGTSVALSGDGNTLAVGSPAEDSSGTGIGSTPDEAATDAGAVYVYSRSGSAWSPQAFVKPSNTTIGDADSFGNSVALSGDGNALAVGALFEDNSGTGINHPAADNAASAGAAYLY